MERNRCIRVIEVAGRPAELVAWAPDGRRLVVVAWHAVVVLTAEGEELWRRETTTGTYEQVEWSPDGRWIVVGIFRREVYVYAADTGALAWEKHLDAGGDAFHVAWSRDGARLATLTIWPIAITIWDAATGRELDRRRPIMAAMATNCVAVWPDASRIAVPSGAGFPPVVQMWEPCKDDPWPTKGTAPDASQEEEPDFGTLGDVIEGIGHTDEIFSVAWSPDGERVATGADDGTVRVWDPATGAELAQLSAGADVWLGRVAWSPDARLIAAGADAVEDSEAKVAGYLFRVASGERPIVLRGHTRIVTANAFSPDSRQLATASSDGTVRIWDISDVR